MVARCLLASLLSALAIQHTHAEIPSLDEVPIPLAEESDVSDRDFWDKVVDLEEPEQEILDPAGLFYEEYLKNVYKALSTHPEFEKQLAEHSLAELRNGDINIDLKDVTQALQDKLTKLKKEEIRRLEELVKMKYDFLEEGKLSLKEQRQLKRVADHFHHEERDKFTGTDIDKLLRTAALDVDKFDKDRHAQFKKYEMHKKMKEEEEWNKMSDAERSRAKQKKADLRKKHNDHKKINEPGHKKALEEVWTEEDQMEDKFNPKTFFALHDTNSDGYWDIFEVEAMVEHELKKAWDAKNNEEDDMIEKEEERLREREKIFEDMDHDNDKMISRDEFLAFSEGDEFEKEEDWKTVDDDIDHDDIFTDAEENDFRKEIKELEDRIVNKHDELRQTSKDLTKMKITGRKIKTSIRRDGVHKSTLVKHEEEVKQKQKALNKLMNDIRELASDHGELEKDWATMTEGEEDKLEERLDALETRQREGLAKVEAEFARISALHKLS